MLIRFFKNNNPSAFIFLPIFALVLWVNGFVIAQHNEIQHSMPFYEMIAHPLLAFPSISTLIALLFIIGEAFLINFIINENNILSKPSFLPALFYIVFMSIDNSMLTLYPVILANLFILLTIYVLIESYRKNNAFSNAFDAGALFSIATLFYSPVLLLFPILGIGLSILRPFNWREWVICLLGFLSPYLFVITFYFWNDQLHYFWDNKIFYIITKSLVHYSSYLYSTMGVIFFLIILSVGKIVTNLAGASQKKIKSIFLFLWIAFFALLSIQRAPSISVKFFSLLAIPFSVFCAEYFLNIKKKWWGEFLFTLLFVSVIINLMSVYF